MMAVRVSLDGKEMAAPTGCAASIASMAVAARLMSVQ